ncbi:AfsR/SARP family transcriptional regulator [Symbioplanes lichenis]|uniref:AfsR/SARP family transcriptional regulator n=1 Tax=Symbioplanes lichenis TaxID=1629072 RepID=UPI0027393975|nr:BTAD domain-containing putative transcriptional regulator [Actinoplanes lichenis]
MEDRVHLRLLGQFEVVDGPATIDLGGSRQRIALAVLALAANETVSAARLIEGIWDSRPPATAHRQVHMVISVLRRALRALPDEVEIRTERNGYRLVVAGDRVDLLRFEAEVAAGRRLLAEQRVQEAAQAFRSGLAWWRGPALGGLDGRFQPEAARLEQARVDAWEWCLEAEVAGGESPGTLSDLERAHAEHPLREGITAALMLALYRAGRQSEAIAVYRRTAGLLAEELGVDPGPALAARFTDILRADAGLTTTAGAPAPGPEQLPVDVSSFTGRQGELAALDAFEGGVVVVSGTAGVGKTALVTRWAHRRRGRFPDGQLHANLHGYGPDEPTGPAEALTGFLRALGVAPRDIPVETERLAADFRTRLSGRRMLIVLDNAATVGQLRPLLPGAPGCLVLITSRDSLGGLVARDGARRLDLDLLPHADAIALLTALLGAGPVAELSELAVLCARLPLALRVAAELALSRTGEPLSGLIAELAGEQDRLDRLDPGGDPYSAVRAVFSWSMHHLSEPAVRLFALLGRHPGADFDGYAAAALTGGDLTGTHRALDELARAHLVRREPGGRFGMHDLLRAYAHGLLSDDEAAADLRRLYHHYLAAAAVAARTLYHSFGGRAPAVEPSGTVLPPLADRPDALAWFDRELSTLLAVTARTAGNDPPGIAARLPAVVQDYLLSGRYADGLTMCELGLRAARAAGDTMAVARLEQALAILNLHLGRTEIGVRHEETTLVLLREHGDAVNEGRMLCYLGDVRKARCEYQSASDYYARALAVFRRQDYRNGIAGAMTSMGNALRRMGRRRQAVAFHEYALRTFREAGDVSGICVALHNLGHTQADLGLLEPALASQREAMRHARAVGHLTTQAVALNAVGAILSRQGDQAAAADHHRRALDRARELGEQRFVAAALTGLGDAARAAGRPREAVAHHTAALSAARDGNWRDEQALAHAGLAADHAALGDAVRADRHRDAARELDPYLP